MSGGPVIAIDGPAGSGKSTVARRVAARLGLGYLDTGAMYRAVAFEALRTGVDPGDGPAVADLARHMRLEVSERVVVNGTDATTAIRGPEVTRSVSVVAANPDVREEMVRRQREWAAAHGGGVVEGRDIGTVVFPEAELKVYLTASAEVRARRRTREMSGGDDLARVAADMARRDQVDSTRQASPLTVAGDAVQLDTTGLDADAVTDRVLQLAAERVGKP